MEDKLARDVMLPLQEYATVRSGHTILEALVALDRAQLGLTYDRHHHRAVLVLGEDGEVVGKLTHWAILRSLDPSLLGKDDLASLSRTGLSEGFIDSLRRRVSTYRGGLGRMCRAAARIRVEDAMVPMRESIDEAAPLIEAIELMVLGHMQSLLVTAAGKVTGILRLSDVFEEIADLIRTSEGA
ncbi:MAG: CBS domain-containing protein [Deltaproteobacteria bacterium]|nr:CBS domain-containing protein [Deltaproteobacteria bacterium]